MTKISIFYAHPYPDRSRANRVLLRAVAELDFVEVRSLYDRYPDFGIDVQREQQALVDSAAIVWQHPMYWYSVPGLLKHWFDKVLTRGFAYGEGGTALRGKRCLWITTTGGGPDAFSPQGMHSHPIEDFTPHIEQTARFCGMQWEAPIIVHGAHKISDEELDRHAELYRERLDSLLRGVE